MSTVCWPRIRPFEMIGSFFLAEFNLVQLLFGVHAPTLFGLLNALEFNLAFEVGVVYWNTELLVTGRAGVNLIKLLSCFLNFNRACSTPSGMLCSKPLED